MGLVVAERTGLVSGRLFFRDLEPVDAALGAPDRRVGRFGDGSREGNGVDRDVCVVVGCDCWLLELDESRLRRAGTLESAVPFALLLLSILKLWQKKSRCVRGDGSGPVACLNLLDTT